VIKATEWLKIYIYLFWQLMAILFVVTTNDIAMQHYCNYKGVLQ
jgi:hypothetical protein